MNVFVRWIWMFKFKTHILEKEKGNENQVSNHNRITLDLRNWTVKL